MDESSPSRHHYQIQLTIDLWSSDLQSVLHDEAILRPRLLEALKLDPMSTKNELNYTLRMIPLTSSSYTTHTTYPGERLDWLKEWVEQEKGVDEYRRDYLED